MFYLKDAIACLNHEMISKAALSSSCAANCFMKVGHRMYAFKLFSHAASLYEQNGESTIGKSINSAIWSYKEAYRNYTFAEENIKAKNVYNKFISLASKLDPLKGINNIEKDKTVLFDIKTNYAFNNKTGVENRLTSVPLDIINTMEDLLQIRNLAKDTKNINNFDDK